jgi:adenylate cyclase
MLNFWKKITFPRQPILYVLSVGFGGLIFLAVSLVLYLGLNHTTQLIKDYHQMVISTAMDKLEREVENLLLPVENESRWIADQVNKNYVDVSNFAEAETLIRGALGATPNVAGIGIVYPDGNMRYLIRSQDKSFEQATISPSEVESIFLATAEHKQGVWGKFIWSDELEQTIIDIRTPLFQKGKMVGVLIVGVTVADLSKSILGTSSDPYLVPFILYGNDHLLAHPFLISGRTVSMEQGENSDWVNGKGEVPLPRLAQFQDHKLMRLIQGPVLKASLVSPILNVTINRARIVDDMYIVATKTIDRFGKTPWVTGVYINVEKSDQTVTMQLFEMSGAGIAVLIVALLLSIKIGRKLARPITRLADAARSVRQGVVGPIDPLPRSRLRELDQAALAFNEMVDGLRERDMIREVFGRYVPETIAASLMKENGELKPVLTQATILFSDIQGFTTLTEKVGPERIVAILNEYFSAVVDILEQHGGVVTQFQGDAVLATFNIPIVDTNHAENALKAALAIRQMLNSRKFGGVTLRCRTGLNTGNVVAGAVGAKGRLNYTVHGDAVNLAARIEHLNKDFGTDLLISQATAESIHTIPLKLITSTSIRGQYLDVKLFIPEETTLPS